MARVKATFDGSATLAARSAPRTSTRTDSSHCSPRRSLCEAAAQKTAPASTVHLLHCPRQTGRTPGHGGSGKKAHPTRPIAAPWSNAKTQRSAPRQLHPDHGTGIRLRRSPAIGPLGGARGKPTPRRPSAAQGGGAGGPAKPDPRRPGSSKNILACGTGAATASQRSADAPSQETRTRPRHGGSGSAGPPPSAPWGARVSA